MTILLAIPLDHVMLETNDIILYTSAVDNAVIDAIVIEETTRGNTCHFLVYGHVGLGKAQRRR